MKKIDYRLATEKDFEELYKRMERDFPYEERRDKIAQRALLSRDDVKWYVFTENGSFISYISVWEYPNTVFIEHFAVNSEMRGNGYGTLTLKKLLDFYKDKKVVLEVEPPIEDYPKKRVEFYKKNGFMLNESLFYEQPSYHGEGALTLNLMSYPTLLTEDEASEFKKNTLNTAYKRI